MDATIIGAWVATGLTLFIFSFLYKDNPLFKLAENLYVGVSVGYTIVKTYDTVIVRLIWKPIVENQEWTLLIPVAIGLLMLTRYVPKAAWLSRYAFAFIVGVGAGLAIPRTVSSFILKQIEDTVRPLLVLVPGDGVAFSWNLLNPASSVNVIIVLIGVSSVLFYFFFSVEHSGPGKAVARTGVLFLMIAFGHGSHVVVDRPVDGLNRVFRSLLRAADPVAGARDNRHPDRPQFTAPKRAAGGRLRLRFRLRRVSFSLSTLICLPGCSFFFPSFTMALDQGAL